MIIFLSNPELMILSKITLVPGPMLFKAAFMAPLNELPLVDKTMASALGFAKIIVNFVILNAVLTIRL